LIELAIAIAEGGSWLGFSCVRGKVLYVNLEIDPASCIDRFVTIYDRLGFAQSHTENIVIWNLRGHALPLDKLVPILVKRMKDEQFAAVIIDPIYKVITGDENNASDMGAFCNQFDKICTELGASAIYCHHHSKGAQGGKKAIDRASGSGVFARDPDAQLDIIELKKPLFKEVETETEDGEVIEIEQFDTTRSAWRLEASLREFPPITPVNFYFDYPLHPVDTEGALAMYRPDGSPLANLDASPKRTTPEIRKRRLDDAFEAAPKNEPITIKVLADLAEVSQDTMRRYLKEFDEDYMVYRGIVQERPLLSDKPKSP
ncbi:MAG: AAA family ATPase, partial [Clostridia bacterium]|nr:AAA family ATPase [Clostridia bacterium]